MHFNADRFCTLLKKQIKDVDAYSRLVDAKTSGATMAHINYRTESENSPCFYLCGISNRDLSNHQAITHEAFTQSQLIKTQTMKEMVKAAIPALDYDEFRLDIQVLKGAPHPRVSISVMNIPLWNEEDGAYTIMIKGLAQSLSRLVELPRPNGRLFKIKTKYIVAADASAAYRIWAAIRDPDLFNPRVNASAAFTLEPIVEIIDPVAAHAALLA